MLMQDAEEKSYELYETSSSLPSPITPAVLMLASGDTSPHLYLFSRI